MISIISSLGSAYHPNNPLISLTNLQTKFTALQTNLEILAPLEAAKTLAINERGAAFKPLKKLVTRISNAAVVSINDSLFTDNLLTIVRKLQGKRAPEKITEETTAANNAEPKQRKSSSQMSYDSQVANFFELITLLKTHGSYNPNENDLKINALETLIADLSAKNSAVVNAMIAAKNGRIARNDLFYNDTDGIQVLTDLVKKYIKSIYGANSPQIKQLTAFKFKKF